MPYDINSQESQQFLSRFFLTSKNIPDLFYETDEKKKAALEKLYVLLEALQKLAERNNQLFTTYALIGWLQLVVASENDKALSDTFEAIFKTSYQMTKTADEWDKRMLWAYTFVGFVEVAFTALGIPFRAVSALENIISTDTATDVLLNSVDSIANSCSFYSQFCLGEYRMAGVNLLGATQSTALTSSGIGIAIANIIRHGFQSPQSQSALAFGGALLGIGCAIGMFCSARVEHLEEIKARQRKEELISCLGSSLSIHSPNDERLQSLKKIKDPIELLKESRRIYESINSLNNEKPNEQIILDRPAIELCIKSIAIEQAKINNHANNKWMFLGCGVMMSILAAGSYSSVFTTGFTPFIIQGAVLMSGLLTQYVSRKYNHEKRLKPFLALEDVNAIENKQSHDKKAKKEAYQKSYSGRFSQAISKLGFCPAPKPKNFSPDSALLRNPSFNG